MTKKLEIFVSNLDKIDNIVRKNMREWIKWDIIGLRRKQPFEGIKDWNYEKFHLRIRIVISTKILESFHRP